MSDKVVADNPEVFKYRDPLGKGTYLSVLIGFILLVGSLIYVLVGFIFKHDSSNIMVALIIAGIALIIMVALPVRGAQAMMAVRAEFSKWAVLNYGLTPMEFLINKSIAEGTQNRILLTDVTSSTQKFLNAEVETVEVTVHEDRTDFKDTKASTPYVKISLDAPRVGKVSNLSSIPDSPKE